MSRASPPARPPSGNILLVLPDQLLATALGSAMQTSFPGILTGFDWEALEDGLEQHRPSVVVTDVAIDTVSLAQHVSQLVGGYPRTHFVVTTATPGLSLVVHLLMAGCAAVVGRDVAVNSLANALSMLRHEGRWPVDLGWSRAALTTGRSPLHPISIRASQVLTLLFSGWKHPAIAEELGLSVKSVERYVAELRKAFGVQARLPGPWERGNRGRPKGV